MAKRKTESVIVAYFENASLDKIELMLTIAKDIVRRRMNVAAGLKLGEPKKAKPVEVEKASA